MTAKKDDTAETTDEPAQPEEEPTVTKAPTKAPELDTQDKTGETILRGDTVEFVYGGDRHIGEVLTIVQDLGSVLVHARVTAIVPGAACTKVNPKTHEPVNSRRRSAE